MMKLSPSWVPAPNKKEAAQNFHQVVLLKDVGILIYGLFTPTFELFSSISCQSFFLRWFWGKYTRLTLNNQIILPVNSSSKNEFVIPRPSTTWQNVADRLLRSGAATGLTRVGLGRLKLQVGNRRKAWETCSIYWVNIRVIYESGLTGFNLFSNIFRHSFFTTSALPTTCQENAFYHH